MKLLSLLALLLSVSAAATSSIPTGTVTIAYPMTNLGDLIYGGSLGAATRLPGNTTGTQKLLCQTGDGVNSAAPAWCAASGLGYESTITAGTSSQYWRGDKTFQTLNTSAVPESGNLYHTDARVLTAPITGFVSGAGTVSATDTVLQAFNKIVGNLAAKVSTTLTSAHILVGNGSNVATDVAAGGDLTLDNTGAFAIGASKVTNAMLAGSIAYSKLALTGAILNADLAGSIAYSKLSLTGAILNADLAGSIAYSKLSLTGSLVDGDMTASTITDSSLASSVLKHANIQLTHNQILALNTTPVQIVAAPGAGKAIMVQGMAATAVFGTAAYTAAGSLSLVPSGHTANTQATVGTGILDNASGTVEKVGGPVSNTNIFDNTALMVFCGTGNPTGASGDTTVNVTVFYRVVNIPLP